MSPIRIPLNSRKIAAILVIAAIALGLSGWAYTRRAKQTNPLLNSPQLTLSALQARSLYFNNTARPWLWTQRPDLLTADDKDPQSERARDMAQAVQSGSLFRRLDRQHRFDALLLVGDPSESLPLLEHLVETKDWTLTALDHSCLVFRRGAVTPWQPADLIPLRKHFPASRDEASFLGKCAAKLLSLRRGQEALALLEQGAKLDADSLEILCARASYHVSRGEWGLALTQASRALTIDAEYRPALAVQSQIFYATKKYEQALVASKKLLAATPDDPGLLFYHAKIAHQRHAYGEEIESLNRLIEIATAGRRPISGYQIYLGQAYAAKGEAEPAVAAFSIALEDPELSKDQRSFAQELITQIKSRGNLN